MVEYELKIIDIKIKKYKNAITYNNKKIRYINEVYNESMLNELKFKIR